MSDLFHDKNISPMLLHEVKEPFDDKEYIYELKLDGIRCIAYLGKEVVLQNKRFKDVTEIYPELSDMCKCVKKNTVLDGELVVLTDGKPDFYALQKRSLIDLPPRNRNNRSLPRMRRRADRYLRIFRRICRLIRKYRKCPFSLPPQSTSLNHT